MNYRKDGVLATNAYIDYNDVRATTKITFFLINFPYRQLGAAKRAQNDITKAQDTVNVYPKISFILPKNHLNIIF